MNYREEQKKVFLDFLDMYTFKGWKDDFKGEYHKDSLEIYVTTTCNLGCTYCYLDKYGDKLYSPQLKKKDNLISNLKIFTDYLVEEGMFPSTIEIFSGELFALSYWEELLEIIESYVLRFPEGKRSLVTMPSNSTFLADDYLYTRVVYWLERFESHGVPFHFSHSVDGKYLDKDSRPYKDGKNLKYDDVFYERMFLFSRKYHSGFHPMVSSTGIENWKKNFDWYIENITKYITGSDFESIHRLYLLEVRNADWSFEQLKHFEDFLRYMVKRVFEICGFDRDVMYKFMQGSGLNILSPLVSSIGRGIGCSEQHCMYVRLGDLAMVPCHRTSYDGYEGGRFKIEGGKVVDIEPINPELYITMKTFDSDSGPVCQDCNINKVCSHYCMGANYEVNKDFFIPVESVCRMEFLKVKTLVEAMDEIGLVNHIITGLRKGGISEQKKADQIEYILNYSRGRV